MTPSEKRPVKSAKGTTSAATQTRNTGGDEVPVLRGLFKTAKGTTSAATQATNTGGDEVPFGSIRTRLFHEFILSYGAGQHHLSRITRAGGWNLVSWVLIVVGSLGWLAFLIWRPSGN